MEHRLLALVRRAGDTRPDAELLARSRDDHAAFAELVARHGPMVWGMCRHMLAEADAEDAFQATFVALLRSTVGDGAALAAWLHRVAVRVSLAARRAAGRRRARERAAAAPETNPPREPDDWADTMAVVHREVAALPEADRSAFVLCVLEGLTQAAAAARLGRTPGAIAGQVARAKKRLVARLTGRGVVPGLAALGTASVAGAVPPGLAGRVLGLPEAGVPHAVLRLAREATGMTTSNTKMMLAAVTLLAGLAAGVLAATGGPPSAPTTSAAGVRPPDPADEPPAEAPDEGTPKPVRSLRGHKARVTSVAYSPDGRWIATAGWDGTARLWDAQTGQEVRRIDAPTNREFSSSVNLSRVLFTRDNGFIVTAQPGAPNVPSVIVWNRRTGEKVHEFPGGGPGGVALSADGRLVTCAAYDALRLYELPGWKLAREIPCLHSIRGNALIFSPDGKTLFSDVRIPRPPLGNGAGRLGFDPEVGCAWDVATGKKRQSVLQGEILAFSPDGRTVCNAGDGGVVLQEAATGELRGKLTGHAPAVNGAVKVNGASFSPDGRTLASAGDDGTIRLWDCASGKELARFGEEVDPFKGGWVLSVAFSPDGRSVVSGGLDNTAHIRDVSKITGRSRAVAERSAAELEADWKDLAGDANAGYAALGRLVSSPVSAVPFLGKRLEATSAVDTKPIERLIGNLDDDDFKVREQATKELRAMGDRAAPALRKALSGNASPEATRRLGELLNRLEGTAPSVETVREVRAVEALEAIGSPEARRLLERLAGGLSAMRLTEEAKASVDRLARRSSIRQ